MQELYDDVWSFNKKKPIRFYYESKCFRYEKPQLGRFREFNQFGIEYMNNNISEKDSKFVLNILEECLENVKLKNYKINNNVKRGLGYYIQDGFEVKFDELGAQKQLAGGGIYKQGVGWAIGIDRLLIALSVNGDSRPIG